MKAYILTDTGTADALKLTDLPIPSLQPDEVLIKIKAIDINPIDSKTLQGAGQYNRIKTDNPIILGWDAAGVIVEVGTEVNTFKKGDAVFGLINFPGHGKTYAEYVAAPAIDLALKPTSLSYEDAVAMTLSTLTAYQAIQTAQLKAGERVFIQGVAGGVGYSAVQIAKNLGAYVIGTGSLKDQEIVEAIGLDEFINYKTTDFSTTVKNIDFVLDTLGGEKLIKAFDIISPNGRLITLPSGVGDAWKAIASERHINASQILVHSNGTDMGVIANWLGKGMLTPKVDHRFTFQDIPEIHRQMLLKTLNGKIVVTL
ncbi:MAG: NADP-dependent oxidoreductase [Siphonobacter sp.]